MQPVDMGRDGACKYCGRDAMTFLIRYERNGQIGFDVCCFAHMAEHYCNSRGETGPGTSVVGIHKRGAK
jgi:glycine cleavage system protein P-like pyridoxal-binding family